MILGVMNKSRVCLLAVTGMLLSQPALPESTGFQSLSDIESRFDPLSVIQIEDGIRRSIDLNILFAFGSAQLETSSIRQLEVLGRAMTGERLNSIRFQIVGHTDAVGDAQKNQRLSEARAMAVVDWLRTHYAIDKARLVAIGKGESELKPHLPKDSHAQRRVEIIAMPDVVTEKRIPMDRKRDGISIENRAKAWKDPHRDSSLNIQ